MTETSTEDLAAWLTAVWDEEERLATEAAEEEHGAEWDALMYPYEGIAVHTRQMGDYGNRTAVTRHIAYHDPASVLARIAADRKILALHAQAWDTSKDERAELYDHCATCWGPWPCATLKALAAPYADREDAPEWLVERQGVEG